MGLLHRKKPQPAPSGERLDPLGFPEPPKLRPPAPAQALRAPAPPQAPEWPSQPWEAAPPARKAPDWPAEQRWQPPAPQAAPKEEWEPPAPRAREWPEQHRGTPPLFIKIDRYRDVVRDVQRLKATSAGLRDALDAMADLQRELQASTSLLSKTLDKFNATLTAIDAKFVRVSAATDEEPPRHVEPVHRELHNQVQDLHSQMQRLRSELKELE